MPETARASRNPFFSAFQMRILIVVGLQIRPSMMNEMGTPWMKGDRMKRTGILMESRIVTPSPSL